MERRTVTLHVVVERAACGEDQMLRWFAGLRVRLLVLVLLAVIPALGSLYQGARNIRRTTEAASQDEALQLARLAAAQQDTAIEGMRQVLAAITRLTDVRALNPDACRQILPRLLNQYAGYSTFSLIDARGDQVCSATPNAPATNVADRPHCQAAMANRSFALGSYSIGRAPRLVLIRGIALLVSNRGAGS